MKNVKTMCSDKLKSLAPSLTLSDKNDAVNDCEVSRPTLEKYLKGDVVKIETATKLITFLSKKVNQRIDELKLANV